MLRMTGLLLTFCTLVFAPLPAQTAAAAVPFAMPGGSGTIWILGSDGRLSAYGLADFRLRMRSVPLPPAARERPENILAISRSGLAIYLSTGGVPRLHVWDLRLGSERTLPWELRSVSEMAAPPAAPANGQGAAGAQVMTNFERPQLAFSADGQSLFWFQNRMRVVQRENDGDLSRTGEFLCWTTGADGRDARTLTHVDFPQCKCDTGACEETCPEIRAWTPDTGVTGFFFLTRFIPGQLFETEIATDLYQEAGEGWKSSKLAVPASQILDALDNGTSYLDATPDSSCCGWVNESSDLTFLVRNGARAKLFDEWGRFYNQDYDVSFFTSNAHFSPGGAEIAYTISATSKAGQPIRLADQGKTNPEELRQIQAALLELPRVEDVSVEDLQKPRISLANTTLIGWADAHRLLVWKDGQLFLADTADGHLTATGLKAERAADVFLK